MFPYLRPGNGESIKWKMRRKGKNLMRFITKKPSASLF